MSTRIQGTLGNSPLSKVTVLAVDDDKRLLRLVKNVLMSFGFKHVHLAYDGAEAIRLLHSNKYDLVITDWKMEPVSGYDLVNYIRNDPDSPDFFIPIIMLSGMAERHHVEEARDVGITEFIAKPFTVDKFKDRIASVFDTPREFVFASSYSGPNRRRRKVFRNVSSERRREE
jgi:two-component system chemotaxis response regulator CheY